MSTADALKTDTPHRTGPEWTLHIAGRAMSERDRKREALSWMDELALLFPPG